MSKGGERAALRRMLGGITASLGDRNTHKTLTETFTVLSMPPTDEGSKRERVERSFAQVPDSDLLQLAERFLQTQDVDAATRNQLQDALWAEASPPEIPMRTRREIARALDSTHLVQHPARFMKMLDRLWVINDDPFSELLSPGQGRSLRSRIERHFIRNPDWSTEELFEALGAFEASDGRFARFIEGALAGEVLLDEPAQRLLAEMINEHLRTTGIELSETGTEGGYPRLALVPSQFAHTRRPKNVVFASLRKPDIRFRSAVDNDIEVVGGDALAYDRSVSDEGIRWRDLQSWWQEEQQISDDTEGKNTLYARLHNSLPDNSPGQRNLFGNYHRVLGAAVYDMPALLPEVWLHWDPKTVKQRGPQALLRFRMDFLLLLPTANASSLKSTGHSTTPATTAGPPTPPSTRTWWPATGTSNSAGTRCIASDTMSCAMHPQRTL